MKFIAITLAALAATASAQVGTGPYPAPVNCTAEGPGLNLIWVVTEITTDANVNAAIEFQDLCGEIPLRVGEVERKDTTLGVQEFFFCLDPFRKYNFRYTDFEGGELEGAAEGDSYKIMDNDQGLIVLEGSLPNDENIDFDFGSCPGEGEGDPHCKYKYK